MKYNVPLMEARPEDRKAIEIDIFIHLSAGEGCLILRIDPGD